MASYTNDKKTIVVELIDAYTKDTLDNYVRASIKEVATTNMNKGASAIEVADAVFDYIDKNFSGSITQAATTGPTNGPRPTSSTPPINL